MNLEDLQTSLRAVIIAVAVLAPVANNVIVETSGNHNAALEAARKDGIAIFLLHPRGLSRFDEVKNAAVIEYAVPVLLQTNPKVTVGANPKWNPLVVERLIIRAAKTADLGPGSNGFQFSKSGGEEALPHPMYADPGLISRVIYLSLLTKV